MTRPDRRAIAAAIWAILAAGCAAAPAAPAVSPAPSATAVPTRPPAPSATAVPTLIPATRPSATPSRTPRPSPTLPSGEAFACLPPDGGRVSGIVAGVIDGDTIVVQVGFQQFTVRYLGIDTPETSVNPPEFMAVEARSRNRDLVTGERVTLVSDPEAGETDIYDRLLRYVIAGDVFVNLVLVREGLARYFPGENACGGAFFAADAAARSENIGIWSDHP